MRHRQSVAGALSPRRACRRHRAPSVAPSDARPPPHARCGRCTQTTRFRVSRAAHITWSPLLARGARRQAHPSDLARTPQKTGLEQARVAARRPHPHPSRHRPERSCCGRVRAQARRRRVVAPREQLSRTNSPSAPYVERALERLGRILTVDDVRSGRRAVGCVRGALVRRQRRQVSIGPARKRAACCVALGRGARAPAPASR